MPSLALSFCSTRALLVSVCLLTAACSTPISPYSPLEDLEEDDEPDDAGVTLPRDAGRPDAGRGDAATRDAGTRDAGTGTGPFANCSRVPTANFGSLFDDDCASRTVQACSVPGQSSQVGVNQRLANLAIRCGASPEVSFGVRFGPSGCPESFGYAERTLQGRISQCIQADLETWRLGCNPSCALMGPLSR